MEDYAAIPAPAFLIASFAVARSLENFLHMEAASSLIGLIDAFVLQ